MKKFFFFIFILFSLNILYAQGHYHGFNPDSLNEITVTGKVTVTQSPMQHNLYSLDEDFDGNPDYQLIFGPFWYKPDSSSAVRPENGDTVTIKGGTIENLSFDVKPLIVYEINGEFWRDPFNSFWNNIGRNINGRMHGNCFGYAFGFFKDSLKSISVSGIAMVDTTFIHNHYYLDEDNDSIPDYFLNFGPPWYRNDSTDLRPLNGDSISIKGKLVERDSLKMIIVLEINNEIWRDTLFNSFAGNWVHKNINSPKFIYSTYDTLSWMRFSSGWDRGGMHGGMMMPDSIFAQLIEIFSGSLPSTNNLKIISAYEIAAYFPNGSNGMHLGGCGKRLGLGSSLAMQLHFNNLQNFDSSTQQIKVRFWNEQNSTWDEIRNTTFNGSAKTVSFNTPDINNFIIITTETLVSVEDVNQTPDEFSLLQNYPNPFNPVTVIQFSLTENSYTNLSVYNLIGQKVAELINQPMLAGGYKVNFNGENLPSGVYIYKLIQGGKEISRKMILIK